MEFVIKKSSWYFISKLRLMFFFYIKNLKKYRINSKTARRGAVLMFILYFVISKIDFWYKKIHFSKWKNRWYKKNQSDFLIQKKN